MMKEEKNEQVQAWLISTEPFTKAKSLLRLSQTTNEIRSQNSHSGADDISNSEEVYVEWGSKFPPQSTISRRITFSADVEGTFQGHGKNKGSLKTSASYDAETILAEAVIDRYKMFYKINKTSLQRLCCVFGAMEISAGYTVVVLKIVQIMHQKSGPSVPNSRDHQAKYLNATNVLHFVAYGTLAYAGMVLVFGSGMCPCYKASKTACLSHFYIQLVDLILVLICLAIIAVYGNGPNSSYKMLSNIGIICVDNIIHIICMNLIIIALYFSFGLYGAMTFFDSPSSPSFRMGELMDADLRLAQEAQEGERDHGDVQNQPELPLVLKGEGSEGTGSIIKNENMQV